jgi:hypothetical protein
MEMLRKQKELASGTSTATGESVAIEALLREAKANKCSHPGLNALESKLEGLSAAEPEPEPEPEPAEEEGVPPE